MSLEPIPETKSMGLFGTKGSSRYRDAVATFSITIRLPRGLDDVLIDLAQTPEFEDVVGMFLRGLGRSSS